MHPGHYAAFLRRRAAEASKLASRMHDPEAKKVMGRLALMYHEMALRREVRELEKGAADPIGAAPHQAGMAPRTLAARGRRRTQPT